MMKTGTGSTLCATSGGWKRRMYSGRCPAIRAICRQTCLQMHRPVSACQLLHDGLQPTA